MNIENKTFEIMDLKVDDEAGKVYLSGYANTKNKADSFGDIPTNYKDKPVYDLTRMKTNPVVLVDHQQSAGMIAGNFVELEEDDKGLRFKLLLMNIEDAYTSTVKHVISAYSKGFGRALSIGGFWKFEDEKNPTHLTKAIIHEISLVAIGADSFARTRVSYPKSLSPESLKAQQLAELEKAVKAYREVPSDENIKKIEGVKNGKVD